MASCPIHISQGVFPSSSSYIPSNDVSVVALGATLVQCALIRPSAGSLPSPPPLLPLMTVPSPLDPFWGETGRRSRHLFSTPPVSQKPLHVCTKSLFPDNPFPAQSRVDSDGFPDPLSLFLIPKVCVLSLVEEDRLGPVSFLPDLSWGFQLAFELPWSYKII